jgi:hypothetical protein
MIVDRRVVAPVALLPLANAGRRGDVGCMRHTRQLRDL